MGNISTLQGQHVPLWKPRMDPELKARHDNSTDTF